MTGSDGSWKDRARRRYRRLLRLYPRAFRDRFGPEMEEAFLRLLELEGSRSRRARLRVWMGAGWDALIGGLGRRLRGPGTGTTTGGDLMGSLILDIRYAFRTLFRRPVFAATAVATLALGIGANTAVFTLTNALLLRPFPYQEPDELVMIWAEEPERGWTEVDISMADAWAYRNRTGVFQDLAVMDEGGANLTGGDRPERIITIRSTPNVLDVLGVEPALGRGFSAGDGGPAAEPVAVLMHGFWARHYGADPSVVGRTMTLDGTPHTIVGVMPADFRFLDEIPDVLVPFRVDPAVPGPGHYDHTYQALARLEPGVTLARAQREVNAVARTLERERPEHNDGWRARVVGLRDEMLGDVAGTASLILSGAVGFVLLMACVNVANLLLARADGRRLEMAIRTALGAGKGRLVRQLLTESVILAGVGGILGLVLAYWGKSAIVAGLPENVPPVFDFSMDGAVLAFAAAASLASALLFGLAPALRSARTRGTELRDGGRAAGGGRGGGRFGGTLVVVQTALAVVLLVGGGILMKSVAGLRARDLGFEPENVLTAAVQLPEERYPGPAELGEFWDGLLTRIRALPGVTAAGIIQSIPLGGSNSVGTFLVDGHPEATGGQDAPARFDWISSDYPEAMEVGVVRGRAFTDADRRDGPPVALVNETFVERYLNGLEPVGTRLEIGWDRPLEIVGVLENHVARGIDEPVGPNVYLSTSQHPRRAAQMVIRTQGPPLALAEAVRRTVAEVDPAQPVFAIETLEAVVDRRVGGYALIANLMGTFALISLVLGAVGIYGVTAYAVGRRTHEIGVRMAMGAEGGDVLRMVLRQGMARSVGGLVLGLVLAFGLTGALAAVAVGVSPRDPAVFTGVAGVLLAVAFLGSYLPGRRATRVDPVDALTAE